MTTLPPSGPGLSTGAERMRSFTFKLNSFVDISYEWRPPQTRESGCRGFCSAKMRFARRQRSAYTPCGGFGAPSSLRDQIKRHSHTSNLKVGKMRRHALGQARQSVLLVLESLAVSRALVISLREVATAEREPSSVLSAI